MAIQNFRSPPRKKKKRVRHSKTEGRRPEDVGGEVGGEEAMPRGVKKTVAAKGVKRWASNKAPAPNLDIKGESVLPKGKKYA